MTLKRIGYIDGSDFEKLKKIATEDIDGLTSIMLWDEKARYHNFCVTITVHRNKAPFFFRMREKIRRIWSIIIKD